MDVTPDGHVENMENRMVLLNMATIERIRGVARNYQQAERERLARADESAELSRATSRREVLAYLESQPDQRAPLGQLIAAMSAFPILARMHVTRMVEESILDCIPLADGCTMDDAVVRITRHPADGLTRPA